MATFEDNAVVTAEDLNNVAIDLGDTTFSAFSDEKFGVDKLNEITADLVGKGILTTGDRCEPIISGDKVYIKNGVIVFGSGAKIRIESPVEIAAAAGDYIYAYNDVLTGKASIIASAEMPDADDEKVVMLAQIDGAGTLADKRILSVAKALSASDFSVQTFSNTIVYEGAGIGGTIELGTTLLKRLAGFKITGVKHHSFYMTGPTNLFYDFTNTKTHIAGVRCYGAGSGDWDLQIEFTLVNTTLLWRIVYIVNQSNEVGDEITMSVDMI